MKTKIVIYRDKKREFRWHMTRKGRIVAESGEGYRRIGGVTKALVSLLKDVRKSQDSANTIVFQAVATAEAREFKK